MDTFLSILSQLVHLGRVLIDFRAFYFLVFLDNRDFFHFYCFLDQLDPLQLLIEFEADRVLIFEALTLSVIHFRLIVIDVS